MKTRKRGKLIVLDGIDGSGKATQTALLTAYLAAQKVKVQTIDFPRYQDNFFGSLVGECIRGEHGEFATLDPMIASVLYAADRFETKSVIEGWLKAGHVVITDRYVSSNQIHQGGKIQNAAKRAAYLTWLQRMEYDVFGIPRPDGVIFLDVSLSLSQRMLQNEDQKAKKQYLRGKKDVLEADEIYVSNSRKSAQWLLRHEPGWNVVPCAKQGKLRTKEDIHTDVVAIVTSLLSV